MALTPIAKRAPYSTAIMRQTITFKTQEAKNYIGTWLNNVSLALFTLDVISRKRLARLNMSTKQHKAATKALNKLFADFEKEIKDDSARLEAVLKAQRITDRAEHNNPRSTQVEITTPELKRAVDLLLAFDNLIILVDTVWLMGIMETDEANQFRQLKSRQLKGLFVNIYKLSQAAKKSAYDQEDQEVLAEIAGEEQKHEITDAPSELPDTAVEEAVETKAEAVA
jgi:hypothetical protein